MQLQFIIDDLKTRKNLLTVDVRKLGDLYDDVVKNHAGVTSSTACALERAMLNLDDTIESIDLAAQCLEADNHET